MTKIQDVAHILYTLNIAIYWAEISPLFLEGMRKVLCRML